MKKIFAISIAPLLLAGCANHFFTEETRFYVDGAHHHVGAPPISRQYRVTSLGHIHPPTRAVILNDNFYGVSGYTFIKCSTVDLVGSDGTGLYSFAQPVCVSSTSSLSELEPYPR